SNTDLGVKLDTIQAGNCIENAVVTLKQGNSTIFDYEDIELVLYAECQPSTAPIESTVNLTARFTSISSTQTVEANGLTVRLAPNPNRGQFQLQLADFRQMGQVIIHDFSGREVHRAPVAAHTERILLAQSHLPKGLYFATLQNEEQRLTQRFIIQ
ncbi:MAG: T9SS type A sorting domain-containing protein, partial [Bacteroidota bacterium]